MMTILKNYCCSAKKAKSNKSYLSQNGINLNTLDQNTSLNNDVRSTGWSMRIAMALCMVMADTAMCTGVLLGRPGNPTFTGYTAAKADDLATTQRRQAQRNQNAIKDIKKPKLEESKNSPLHGCLIKMNQIYELLRSGQSKNHQLNEAYRTLKAAFAPSRSKQEKAMRIYEEEMQSAHKLSMKNYERLASQYNKYNDKRKKKIQCRYNNKVSRIENRYAAIVQEIFDIYKSQADVILGHYEAIYEQLKELNKDISERNTPGKRNVENIQKITQQVAEVQSLYEEMTNPLATEQPSSSSASASYVNEISDRTKITQQMEVVQNLDEMMTNPVATEQPSSSSASASDVNEISDSTKIAFDKFKNTTQRMMHEVDEMIENAKKLAEKAQSLRDLSPNSHSAGHGSESDINASGQLNCTNQQAPTDEQNPEEAAPSASASLKPLCIITGLSASSASSASSELLVYSESDQFSPRSDLESELSLGSPFKKDNTSPTGSSPEINHVDESECAGPVGLPPDRIPGAKKLTLASSSTQVPQQPQEKSSGKITRLDSVYKTISDKTISDFALNSDVSSKPDNHDQSSAIPDEGSLQMLPENSEPGQQPSVGTSSVSTPWNLRPSAYNNNILPKQQNFDEFVDDDTKSEASHISSEGSAGLLFDLNPEDENNENESTFGIESEGSERLNFSQELVVSLGNPKSTSELESNASGHLDLDNDSRHLDLEAIVLDDKGIVPSTNQSTSADEKPEGTTPLASSADSPRSQHLSTELPDLSPFSNSSNEVIPSSPSSNTNSEQSSVLKAESLPLQKLSLSVSQYEIQERANRAIEEAKERNLQLQQDAENFKKQQEEAERFAQAVTIENAQFKALKRHQEAEDRDAKKRESNQKESETIIKQAQNIAKKKRRAEKRSARKAQNSRAEIKKYTASPAEADAAVKKVPQETGRASSVDVNHGPASASTSAPAPTTMLLGRRGSKNAPTIPDDTKKLDDSASVAINDTANGANNTEQNIPAAVSLEALEVPEDAVHTEALAQETTVANELAPEEPAVTAEVNTAHVPTAPALTETVQPIEPVQTETSVTVEPDSIIEPAPVADVDTTPEVAAVPTPAEAETTPTLTESTPVATLEVPAATDTAQPEAAVAVEPAPIIEPAPVVDVDTTPPQATTLEIEDEASTPAEAETLQPAAPALTETAQPIEPVQTETVVTVQPTALTLVAPAVTDTAQPAQEMPIMLPNLLNGLRPQKPIVPIAAQPAPAQSTQLAPEEVTENIQESTILDQAMQLTEDEEALTQAQVPAPTADEGTFFDFIRRIYDAMFEYFMNKQPIPQNQPEQPEDDDDEEEEEEEEEDRKPVFPNNLGGQN